MHIKRDETDTRVVCHLQGNLEHLAVSQLTENADVVPNKCVVFELSGVPFVDVVGLRALLRAVRHTRLRGGEAVVCGARPAVARPLEASGLPTVVGVFDRLSDAEAALL